MLSIGNIVKKSQPSMFWCMRNISKPKREAMYTIFAFSRHIDNIVNSSMKVEEKVDLLNAWHEEIDNIYEKNVPATNIGRKIYKNCMRFNLPKDLILEILNSAFLNIPSGLFAPSLEVFDKYIYGAIVVPLRLSFMVIGDGRPATQAALAKYIGYSLMITYILRDIKDDAKFGRVYIPEEYLKGASVDISSPMAVAGDKYLYLARERLAKDADKYYVKARRLLSKMDRRYAISFNYITNVGFSVFEKMKNRGWEIISPKPKIGKIEKIRLCLKALWG